jgi:hypothetical protein
MPNKNNPNNVHPKFQEKNQAIPHAANTVNNTSTTAMLNTRHECTPFPSTPNA